MCLVPVEYSHPSVYSIKMIFEAIDSQHSRAKVYGGWLVKAFEDVAHDVTCPGFNPCNRDVRVAMAFVPDPKHRWKLDDPRPTPFATGYP